jgi:large subunit ribosomal protein L6
VIADRKVKGNVFALFKGLEMTRLGKKPLQIPEKVKIDFKNQRLEITGPLGKAVETVYETLSVKVSNNEVLIVSNGTTRKDDMIHGLTRGLVKNMLIGVTQGYKKDLEIQGLGFKSAVEGKNLNLQLGFSHPVVFPIPEGIKITIDKQNFVTVAGVSKYLVGETAARIRAVCPPEPYKGTGIRYVGEHIIRKAGKAAAVGAGATGGGGGAAKK